MCHSRAAATSPTGRRDAVGTATITQTPLIFHPKGLGKTPKALVPSARRMCCIFCKMGSEEWTHPYLFVFFGFVCVCMCVFFKKRPESMPCYLIILAHKMPRVSCPLLLDTSMGLQAPRQSPWGPGRVLVLGQRALSPPLKLITATQKVF